MYCLNAHWPSLAIIDALTRTMAARDPSIQTHAQRVQHLAVRLAKELRILDPGMVQAIAAAALLHDIGKLGIPDRLLDRPEALTPDEHDRVKRHAIIGADLLSTIGFPGPLAFIVRHHHENWDGSGYPDGLRGEAIPLGARVLAIADGYDALTSDRPHRTALSHADAVAIVRARRGAWYEPRMVEAFVQIVAPPRSEPSRKPARKPRDASAVALAKADGRSDRQGSGESAVASAKAEARVV